MRFCPFCSAENGDELAVCQSCGRRLPPLPPRRARNAPGTGVQLPPRTGTANPPPTPARKAGTTNPPPGAAPSPSSQPVQPVQPGILVTSAGFAPAAPRPSGLRAPGAPMPASGLLQ